MHARCPHCQSVFLTERPGVQFCPSCGQQVDVPAFPAESGKPSNTGAPAAPGEPSPSPGAPASVRPGRALPPWERHAELGWLRALGQTWVGAITDPGKFFASLEPRGGLGLPLLYAWLIHIGAVLLGLPFIPLIRRQAQLRMERAQEALDRMGQLSPQVRELLERFVGSQGHGQAGIGPVASILLFPILLFTFAAVVHLLCLLLGMAKNGFAATFRGLCYAAAPLLFMVTLPGAAALLGLVVGVWYLVLAALAIESMQESSFERSLVAVIAPLFLACCCPCVLVAFTALSMGAAR